MQIIDLDEMCVIKWRLTDVCNYHCSYCIRKPLANTKANLANDFIMDIDALPDVVRIAEELHQIHNKQVKIDLIGGEISLFDDLDKLIYALLDTECIAKVNITTNLYRDIEYYLNLCNVAKEIKKKISITASYHYGHTELDAFMEKAKVLYNELKDSFKCETVITNVNKDVEAFIEKCNEIGCHYMCEEDLLDPTKRGKTVRNYKVGNRYKVTHDDGSVQLYTTRNEVIKTYGADGIAMDTRGMRCTRDNNYVYIELNAAIPCHSRVYIKNYRVSEYPQLCQHGTCTLCGHMSVFK